MQEESTKPLFDIPRMAFTYDEAAHALSISRATLERMVARREIPHVKIARSGKPLVRFRPEAIAAWLQSQEQR